MKASEPQKLQERLQREICKQVEYYFGDINLYKDRFLKTYIQNENREGWVPMEILMTFKHLRELTNDHNKVVFALKKQSELVEISDDKKFVRRRRDKPEGNHAQVLANYKQSSVYIGNFPLDATFDDIKNDYLSRYGDIPSFVMRRARTTQNFRGSIFATFETVELAHQFLRNPNAQQFRGHFLERKMQLDYERSKPFRFIH